MSHPATTNSGALFFIKSNTALRPNHASIKSSIQSSSDNRGSSIQNDFARSFSPNFSVTTTYNSAQFEQVQSLQAIRKQASKPQTIANKDLWLRNGASRPGSILANIAANIKDKLGLSRTGPELPTLPEKLTSETDALVPNPDNVPLSQSEFDVIRYTNALREMKGLDPLIVKQNLMDTSRLSSERMKHRSQMVHGTTSGWSGENIAAGYSSSKTTVNGWKNSSGHYRNMMGDYKYIGVGDTKEKDGSVYWTQQFI